jgi:plastocyanin
MPRSAPVRPGTVLAALLVLGGCGGGGDAGPDPAPLVVAMPATASGDNQTGAPDERLKEPLRVVITRDGVPVNDVDVDWEVTGGGSVDPQTSTSDDAGIAETFWTLGPLEGGQSVAAVVDGADGSPVSFSAAAENPSEGGATVQVLSSPGNVFQPASVEIIAGQTVTWVWPEGSTGHNVTPDNGTIPAESGNLASGPNEYAFTFAAPGTYRYYCEAHGGLNGQGMSGTVTVLAVAP